MPKIDFRTVKALAMQISSLTDSIIAAAFPAINAIRTGALVTQGLIFKGVLVASARWIRVLDIRSAIRLFDVFLF